MALFEDTPLPGAPYLVAAFISMWSFLHCFELPPEPQAELEYIKYHANNHQHIAESVVSDGNKSSIDGRKWTENRKSFRADKQQTSSSASFSSKLGALFSWGQQDERHFSRKRVEEGEYLLQVHGVVDSDAESDDDR